MKFLIPFIVLMLVTLNAQNIYSQKKKNNSQKPTIEKSFTVVDRLTKFLPFSTPKPCTFYLADFGDSREKLKSEAKKIGLDLIDNDTNDLVNKGLYCYDPDDKTLDWRVYYSFGIKNGKYNGLHFSIDFQEIQDAVQIFDDLKKTLYYSWGNDDIDKLSAKSTCKSDNTVRRIMIKRESSKIMMWISVIE